MTKKKFCVLVLEDDAATVVAVSSAFRLAMPDDLILTAHSIAEARLLLEAYLIDFFVLDVNLPDGSGIDFLMDVTAKNPCASVIIITAEPLPEHRDQATAFDVLRFMEKPIDYRTLAGLVREHRDTTFAAQSRGDTVFFAASLTNLTVLDIIQLKCLNRATQVLDFVSSRYGRGRVCFYNGDIFHAETATATGQAAVSEIIGWRGGRAEEVLDPPPFLRTIFVSWQSLLLNAAQAADETQASQS